MITVEKFIPGGMSLGTADDGRKIFFWNALPGENVLSYQITKQKSHYSEAIAAEIENYSPYRVAPEDACFLATSPWQILDFNYELEQKQQLVVELFREHDIKITAPEIITDHHEYFYRNKMEYSLYYNHALETIQLAFHVRGSHQKLPITSSSIERPEIFQRATEIVNELNHNGDEARRYQSLLLRCNQAGEVSGGLLEKKKPHPAFEPLADIILGQTYSYSPNGFFQINLPVYELALAEIKKHITSADVLDLYSGVGTIGLSVARDKNLTLVEVDNSAFAELINNSYNLSNVLSILSKSEEVLTHVREGQTVILDPPRAGCDAKLIQKLLEVKPVKIIYLSCNPATQARDIKLLLEKYQIETVKIFNFFPRTPHIENIVILSPKSPLISL